MSEINKNQIASLEAQLADFNSQNRSQALKELKQLADNGAVNIKKPKIARVNLHSHTFFSFNAYGYSPSAFAWEAYKQGMEMAGIVDFDVLDGVQEILEAGDILGLKTEAGIETRVFIPEFADREINSPNEPGVYYLMGVGFWKKPDPLSKAEQVLDDMKERARSRNVEMLKKINGFLDKVSIDYEKDVIVLTPSGNATERHMLAAYDRKAREKFPDAGHLVKFWAKALEETTDTIEAIIDNQAKLHDLIRKKLMKAGGVGYARPGATTFPRLDDVTSMTIECGAIPTATWLDGTLEGEKNSRRMLEFFIDRSIMALNIIPERNWNITNAAEKKIKTEKLGEIIEAARERHLPLLVGTEMNKYGQPFVDNFDAPELQPYVDDFLGGARFVYGHTTLGRFADFGCMSNAAQSAFGVNMEVRKQYYTEAGSWGPTTRAMGDSLRKDADSTSPGKLLEIISSGKSEISNKF